MGCNCGGRARATTSTGTGQATVFRLYHPNGATVDYWTRPRVEAAQKAVPGSFWEQVDAHTGLKVTAA